MSTSLIPHQVHDESASVHRVHHEHRKVTFTGDGVAIVEVAPEMPADGLLKAGDLLVGADGQRLELTDDLHRILEGKKPGDSVKLSVVRGGAPSSTSPHGEDGKKTGGKDDGKDDGADTDPPAEQSADEESVIVPLVAADDGRPVMWALNRTRPSMASHFPDVVWTLLATATWVCRSGSPARESRWVNAAATSPVTST